MIDLLVAALIVYRLSVLIAQEDGPFNVAQRWRNLFLDDNWVGRGVRCVACVSFWLALPVALLLPGGYPWYIAWIAIAGGALWLWRMHG